MAISTKTTPPPAPIPFLNALTRPHPRLTDPQICQSATLLALMLLITAIVGGLLLLAAFILAGDTALNDADVILLALAWAVSVIAYGFNRNGYFWQAAALFIGVVSLIFAIAPFYEASSPGLLAFAIIPVLITAMFFGLRYVFATWVLTIGISGVLLALNPQLRFTYYVVWFFLILGGVVTLAFARHRQTLETLRRAEIEAANAALRQSEAELELRVAMRTLELEQANEQLRQAKERAEQADHLKSHFLASMSHELRTPMNAVLNFTEFVALGMLGDVNAQQRDALTKAIDSGRHLMALINDVLDISKIESGLLTLLLDDDVAVEPILEAVMTTGKAIIGDKPVALVADVQPHLPTMRVDQRRLKQILINLMSNACKFTESGTVTLSAHTHNGDMVFRVADTGPGIAPDDHETIFEPFIQTETGIEHAQGTGLGLPITRRLVQAHGGSITLESDPGDGAAFTVTMPIKAQVDVPVVG